MVCFGISLTSNATVYTILGWQKSRSC